MFRVADLLPDALKSLVGPKRARQASVLDVWSEVVGEPGRRYTKPAGVRGGTLVVVTRAPALAYELRLRRQSLIEALNTKAGGAVIDDIQIVVRPDGRVDEGPGSVGDRG